MGAESFAEFSHDKLYKKYIFCNSESVRPMNMNFFVDIDLTVAE